MLMEISKIERLCEDGQDQLSRMEYLEAERTLAAAEEIAWWARDWDTLARLYMPLQEARRQRRQRCGEGIIRLTHLANGSDDRLDGRRLVQNTNHGQILIAGWGSIQPAIDARRAQLELGLYVDVFLAAVYPVEAGRIVAIVPGEDVVLPPVAPMSVDSIVQRLPAHSIVLGEAELSAAKTYAATMAFWEQLHAPFLAVANATVNPIRRIEAYRKTIRVDYACELAHQGISDAARQLSAGANS
jgi:hypothetical protein